MAYDKVIDSAALERDLTDLADVIRSKSGTTAPLAFPAGFANAVNAISTGKTTTEVYDITLASTLGNGTNSTHTLLTSNAYVKNNRSKSTFAIFMFANTPVATESKLAHSLYHGNINIAASNVVRYGFSYCGSSTSAVGFSPITNNLTTSGYNVSFRTTSAGNLQLYVASDRSLPAGDYTLLLINWEGL